VELKPGYKQTDVGVIPEDWETRPCSTLSDLITVGIVVRPTQYYTRQGVPALRSANIREDGIDDADMVFISAKSNALLSKSQVRAGDVLTVRTGYPGTSAVVPAALAGSNCIDILIMRPSKAISSTYLAEWINSPFGKYQVLRNQGGLAQQHFNVGDLRNLVVALPMKAEQEAIAEALIDADTLIDQLELLITKKRQIKQGAMQELLTGKRRIAAFGPAKPQYKNTDAGQIPEDWGVHALRDEIESLDAGVSVNSTEDEVGVDVDNIYILKTSSVANGIFNPNECKRVARNDLKRVKLPARANCIVISRMNTPDLVGECGYINEDYPHLFLPDRLWMIRFRSRTEICPKWLNHLLSSAVYKRKLKEVATGTSGSMKNISQDALLSLRVPWPEPKEQFAIANIISDMDAELKAIEDELAKARGLKQGMMQELLTGRIRLK
jgi:type I restriction enzyme S subunit